VVSRVGHLYKTQQQLPENLPQLWRERAEQLRAVSPDLRFYLSSGGHERHTQDLALAVVRTIVVAASPSN
jgi:hypothetical protein